MNIKVDNVTKIIKKVKVLDHVSLEFESGEITGLKGINGSGKTMIMRIISGLILQQEKERGALIVLTCHDYSVLKELSDSIYFIEEGRVVGYERQ